MRKFFTNKINTLLDGTYIVPRRIRGRSIRIPAARPRKEQIYFIGATNVPVDRLDPALTRPGRMGRHVWFRTPTKQDRLDVLDLYLDKVAHADELDQPTRREEIARVTNGYSPAMLEQVTSMALTIAHHSGRAALAVGRPRRGNDHARGRHGGRRRVRPGGEPRRRHSRGRPCRSRSCLPEGRRIDAALHPDARRRARPSSGAREGGALQPLPQRGVRASRMGARRDGGGARLLRRELERRRRRRPERDRCRPPSWSAPRRWGRSRSR